MVRRDGAEVRRERIEGIGRRVMSLLEKHDGKVPLGKTVSVLAYEFGLTKEKIMDYLEILEDLDRFVLDREKGEICSLKKRKAVDE